MTEQATTGVRPEQRATEAQYTEVTRHWRHAFGSQRGLLQVWTAIRDEAGNFRQETIRYNNFSYPNAAQTAAEWALEKSKEESREIFYCAHLLDGPERRKENAGAVISLWAELDGVPVPNGELKPTSVVESSPGHYHCRWRLTDAIPATAAEVLNKRIADEIGADSSGSDRTQLLRVPGTTNNKYEDKPQVRLVELDGGRSYSVEKLDQLLPASEKPKAEHEPEKESGDEPPVALSPEALKVWCGEKPKVKDTGEINRSASLLKIGRVLYDAGANRAVVVAALRKRDEALGWRKYTDRRDSEERYLEIFDELKNSGRSPQLNIVTARKSESPAQTPKWPEMEEAAYRGIFGHIVEVIEPHTEGDPVAVLTNVITAVGNAMGRGPYMQIGATKHHTNLFVGHVGATAKGRKGSAWDPVKDIMHASDRHWTANRILSGLSSGEGLISEVRDPVQVPDKDGTMKTIDQGVTDKRLMVMEGELSQVLKVIKREGNTLSPVMRVAWDGETLRTMVKHSPHRATDPHISIAGHITLAELERYLTETEMANGLANRILWVLVKRSKSLPFGGEWHTANLAPITRKLAGILEFANQNLRMTWGDDARGLWCEAYEMLTEDRAGMFGAITARAEAQALRLAMIFALADYSHEIRRSHVESALAVWEYAEASALYVFGGTTGDPDADNVLSALEGLEAGMTRNEVREFFGRNKGAAELDRVREVLLGEKRIHVTRAREGDGKKPTERWYAA